MTKATASATVKRNDKQSISQCAIGKHSQCLPFCWCLSVTKQVAIYRADLTYRVDWRIDEVTKQENVPEVLTAKEGIGDRGAKSN